MERDLKRRLLSLAQVCDELLYVSPRLFHATPAFQIRLPLRGQSQSFGSVRIEGLGHQGNQITDDGRMFEQRFDNRMRQLGLIEFGVWLRFGLLVTHKMLFSAHPG
jgi:hypothetical protein